MPAPFAAYSFAIMPEFSGQLRAFLQTLTIPKHNPQNKSRLKVVLAEAFSGNKL